MMGDADLRLLHACAALLVAMLLAGCATIPSNPLAVDRVGMMHLEAVDVEVAPDGSIWWGEAERRFAEAHRETVVAELRKTRAGAAEVEQDAAAAVANSPQAKEHVRNEAASRLQAVMLKEVSQPMRGAEPVRLKVTIHTLRMPSAAQRLVVGGQPILVATVKLVEGPSGREIASYPNLTTVAYAGNGWAGVLVDQFVVDDFYDNLATQFAGQYRQWLIKT